MSVPSEYGSIFSASPHFMKPPMSFSCFLNMISDSVTQTGGNIIISQGEPVLLNCTYHLYFTTTPSPFWYVQYPNQPPRLFLRHLGRENSDEGIRKGFNATHDNQNKSFDLWKPSTDLSDSATYYCAVSDTVTGTTWGGEQKLPRLCLT
uniref:Ig-like domain-containing protein n=1 Tax=Pelusios castaneus TaxID=367368 RepID=A0A8C8VFS9_9SAUR